MFEILPKKIISGPVLRKKDREGHGFKPKNKMNLTRRINN